MILKAQKGGDLARIEKVRGGDNLGAIANNLILGGRGAE